MPRPPALVAACLALAATPACREAASALGDSPAEARTHADGLLGALASRFGPLAREPAYSALRPKLVRASLVPSRVFTDPSAWTAAEGAARRVEFAGRRSGGGYRIGLRAGAPAPDRPADYRGVLGLRRLGSGEYEWTARDELAVGTVAGDDLARALTAVFLAAEGLTEREARVRAREALPRTTAALGRLFSLDVLQLIPSAGGSTVLTIEAALHPRGIEDEYPRYARYLRKYAVPLRGSALAYDDAGRRWWQVHVGQGRVMLRLGIRRGRLAPLEGAPDGIPDTLRVRVDLATKMGIFRVGFRGLEGSVALTRTPHERAFAARFAREPDWDLPFLLEPLLRRSLRRPFEGEGALLAFAVRDGGAQTLLTREFRIAVKESWIVRWLGGLLGGAVSEFRLGAEEEADRFSGEVLEALRADVVALD